MCIRDRAQLGELRTVITSLAANLSAESLSKSESYIIGMVNTEWEGNPFLDILPEKTSVSRDMIPVEKEAEAQKSMLRFTYSGFLSMGDRSLAIINGLEYAIGDWIDEGEYILDQFGTTEAVLKNKKSNKTVVVPIHE